jgi:RHS repeat-associated protein
LAVETQGVAGHPAAMRTLTHSHDADDQLAAVAETDAAATPTGSFAYGYDLAGNRTTADRTTPAAGTVNRQWTPNGLNQLTAQSAGPEAGAYSHDLDGNLLADNTRTYQWDAENRLVGVTGPFGTVTWEYDAFSRRVKQHDTAPAGPEIVRDLIWEGLSIIESRNQATGEIRRFYGNGEERQLAAAVTRLYYTTDHLGSIRELTDATGTIRARYDYDPYGNVTKLSGDLDTDFAYTGHYYHAASGLHLAPYRGYNPKLGRWLSRDPIEEEGGINLYGYVGNGPIGSVDPLGLESFMFPREYAESREFREGFHHGAGLAVVEILGFLGELGQLADDISRKCLGGPIESWAPGVGSGIGGVSRSLRSLRAMSRASAISKIPQKARDALAIIKKTGKPMPGCAGGRTFKNLEGRLPKGGNYREFGIDPKVPGQNRNATRIVTDQNSQRAWYTDDHYQAFSEF